MRAMSTRTVSGLIGMVFALGMASCAAEGQGEGTAPAADVAGVDALDEGTSYNGWTQSMVAEIYPAMNFTRFEHTFTRSYGDATRGGGGCLLASTGNSCSADSTCIDQAKATWGSTAYGYCYQGACYARTGSQGNYCALNQNRSPGTLQGLWFSAYSVDYALSCMTKAAGPSTNCGSTNTSLYMRSMDPVTVNWTSMP